MTKGIFAELREPLPCDEHTQYWEKCRECVNGMEIRRFTLDEAEQKLGEKVEKLKVSLCYTTYVDEKEDSYMACKSKKELNPQYKKIGLCPPCKKIDKIFGKEADGDD